MTIKSPPLIILVVEDEAILLMNASGILQDAGHEVIEARDADEAIDILESRSDIDVVFTDIEMPGSMNGIKLAHAIRNRWPPVRLIVTSGRVRIEPAELPDGVPFFTKPYLERQLLDAVAI